MKKIYVEHYRIYGTKNSHPSSAHFQFRVGHFWGLEKGEEALQEV